jgi:hypothetical protein
VRRCLLGHRAGRAVVGVLPPFGGRQPAVPGKHPDPAETELEGDLLDLRVAGVEIAGHQPVIVRRRRQQVARAQVARLQPLTPRHPGRREQCALAGQQHHLGHARWRVRRTHHGDRPVPADVAGQGGGEGMGGRVLVLSPDPEVAAHLGLRAAGLGDAHVGRGQFHGGRPSLLDRGGENLVDGERFGWRVHVGHCRIRVRPPPRSTVHGRKLSEPGRMQGSEPRGDEGMRWSELAEIRSEPVECARRTLLEPGVVLMTVVPKASWPGCRFGAAGWSP